MATAMDREEARRKNDRLIKFAHEVETRVRAIEATVARLEAQLNAMDARVTALITALEAEET